MIVIMHMSTMKIEINRLDRLLMMVGGAILLLSCTAALLLSVPLGLSLVIMSTGCGGVIVSS